MNGSFWGWLGTTLPIVAPSMRNYGYPNPSGLIEATEAFEIRRVGKLVHIRAKPTKNAAREAAKTVLDQPRDQ